MLAGFFSKWAGAWTFIIAVCFVLFLLFGSNWYA